MTVSQIRQEVQKQKELPTLSSNVERILSACGDHDIKQSELAEVLGESPTIAARLLGLANSAFFGQQGRVHSLPHAISVLGMVTVRSVAAGLALSGVFKTGDCPHFQADRHWAASVMTALMASQLNSSIQADVRPPNDSVYMAGLLHSIGLLALVFLHPEAMDRAFMSYDADRARGLAGHIQAELGVDHYQAGVWLGSKWHLPREILLVIEHHGDSAYRGEHWPLVRLEGLCVDWAGQIVDGVDDLQADSEAAASLGLTTAVVERVWSRMQEKLAGIRDLAALFAPG